LRIAVPSLPVIDGPPTFDDFLTWIRPAWHRDAACKERPDVNFFPARGEDTAPAKAVCQSCLVQAECRTAAADELHGIWGGRSRREARTERQALRGRPSSTAA